MIRTSAVGTAVAIALAMSAAPAAEAASTHRKTDLVLSYMAEAGYAVAVKLRCDPAGGAHPKPAKACATLRKVAGQPDRIKAAEIMCMMLYTPVTAEITGTWQGRQLTWRHTYGNRCEMTRATGVLFIF
jgi:uncharacterized membrane protein